MPGQAYKVCTDPSIVLPRVKEVCARADVLRDSFGFLPEAAYFEQAAQGRLWIAVAEDSRLISYLLFGGRHPHYKVFQLFVEPGFRKSGVGGAMLRELKSQAEREGVQTISARVAADLEANRFWDRQGFHIVRQTVDSKITRRKINVRVLEIPSNCLFSTGRVGVSDDAVQRMFSGAPVLGTALYVIDLNVMFDVTRHRVHESSARQLISASMHQLIQLAVTAEFAKELKRHTAGRSADPMLELAKCLPTLPAVPVAQLDGVVSALRQIVFPSGGHTGRQRINDESDLIHLATAISHFAQGFVTREKAILSRASDIRSEFGLDVVAPMDLFGNEADDPPFLAAQVDGQDVAFVQLPEGNNPLASQFLEGVGCSAETRTAVLDRGSVQFPRRVLVAMAANEIISVASWSDVVGAVLPIDGFLFIDERKKTAERSLYHLLECISRALTRGVVTVINITTGAAQVITHELLSRKGFRITRERAPSTNEMTFSRVAFAGLVNEASWTDVRAKLERQTGANFPSLLSSYAELINTGILIRERNSGHFTGLTLDRFETVFAPAFLIVKGREGALVPIREQYARELLHEAGRQGQLLPGKEAMLWTERAYFGQTSLAKKLRANDIAFFYVSAFGGGRGEMVGMARVTFVGAMTILQAQLTLTRQGVLSPEDLGNVVDRQGRFGVFTFDNFTACSSAISFRELKAMGCVSSANLVTSQRLTHQQLCSVVRAGWCGAGARD